MGWRFVAGRDGGDARNAESGERVVDEVEVVLCPAVVGLVDVSVRECGSGGAETVESVRERSVLADGG